MKKFLELFKRFRVRERILLVAALIVILYIGIDKIAITPFLESIRETNERLEMQEKLLKKYRSFVANKEQYESRLHDLENYYTGLQEGFLSEETEELAFAKFQEMMNNLATRNGLVVSRSTALKKEVVSKKPYLVALSINIEVNEIDSSQKLQNFLYEIEYNSSKFLFIDNLKIRTFGYDVIKGAAISSTVTAIASIERRS
ncbi:MAG: hypothetical protein E3K32_03250 [wastewater metagenome]|nr:hypothetical protein [Candidatus Loosdrechtia aerotolerans]